MVAPWEDAATVSRPGPPARSAAGGGPVLMTSTETSGSALPGAKPGPPVVEAAFPAFSYAVSGRPPTCGGSGRSDSLAEMRVAASPTGSPVLGVPRYAAHSARTGAATTVATTVVVTARARIRSRRAARSLGSIGKPVRSKRGAGRRPRPPERSIAAWTAVRGAGTSGRAAVSMPPEPGQGAPAPTRSATRRQRGQSSTCRTSSARRVVESRTCPSPVSRETLGQLPVSTTERAVRVRSTSQAAPDRSSRAAAGGVPRTAASSVTPRRWRTASSRASRCSGVVPAASGQASRASSVRRYALTSSVRWAPPDGSPSVPPPGARPGYVCSGARRAQCAPCRTRRCSASRCRQPQRAKAYSQARRSPSSGQRPGCRSATASTSPSTSVAVSWSHRTDRQYVNRPSR